MRGRCIGFLLLTAVASSSIPASAQQAPGAAASSSKPAQTPEDVGKIGNINLPVSTENWGAPADIKTGLEPRPSVVVSTDERPEFVRELVRVQWREADPFDVWLIRPKVSGKVLEKPPVVLYLYSFSDTDERFRDNGWCQRATADGYAAVGFVSALTDYRFRNHALTKWFVSELPEALGSSTHDVQLILDFLALRGDIDMSRVGMFGLGSGGTIAILAASADARITTVDVLDPWGDWPDWFASSALLSPEERTKDQGKEFLQPLVSLDPITYLPKLKTANVRIQQISNDPITPAKAQARISSSVPEGATVVKYQSAQDLLKSWQTAGLSGWIKKQLHPELLKGAGENHSISMK